MWSKIYVGIIVLVVILFLNAIGAGMNYLDKKYGLKENYYIPVDCIRIAMCGMNGNILLLFLVYIIIPDSYYENVLKMLDPREIHKNAANDSLGLNKITKLNS
jgi:hypothetical protein